MKNKILKKMFELSDGKTSIINFNCQLFPEFSKEVSEVEFRKYLKDLEQDGLIEIISGFRAYTSSLSDLSLLNLTKDGLFYVKNMRSVNVSYSKKDEILKTISVVSGGKSTYKIDVNSDLYPVLKNKINRDGLNNILIQLRYDKLISAPLVHYKGVPYIDSLKITIHGLSLFKNFINKKDL